MSHKEYETEEESEEELKIKQSIVKILEEAKNKVHLAFEKAGFDEAYFTVKIDLRVRINDTEIRVYDFERALGVLE
jgi:hypothetical protein